MAGALGKAVFKIMGESGGREVAKFWKLLAAELEGLIFAHADMAGPRKCAKEAKSRVSRSQKAQ